MKTDFNIVRISQASKLHPRPEYIFAHDPLTARISAKYLPDCITLYPTSRNTDYIYQTFMNHLTDLRKVYLSLIDEESRKTFCGYWLSSISERLGEIVYTNTHHYITEGFIPDKGAVVIDVGACNGDMSKFFSEMGCKVYAFEMDRKNFENAKKIAEESHFVVENLGLGSYKRNVRYESLGSMSQVNPNGSETAQITTLDAYVSEHNISHVDCIKLDVEGAELDVLKGATTTIARFKPILLLSAYHKPDDFWVLMNFVKSIRSDYEFAMRQYRSSLEDLPPSESSLQLENTLYSLGLDVKVCWYNECCILAR